MRPENRPATRPAVRAITTFRALATGVMFALVSGCGSSSSPNVVDPVPTGTIAVLLTPSSVTLAPGATGSVGLRIDRGGGFSGAVTLAASGVPSGVTVSFVSSTIAAGATTTGVSIVVGSGVAPATTSIQITGTNGTLMSQPVVLTLRTT